MPPTNTAAAPTALGRAEIDPAALDVVRRFGAEVLASARRWAETPEDAEDAYQRGLEIMLTKAPSTDPDHLVPWLKTVVKREAWAIRRQRERHTPPASDAAELDSPAPACAHDHAERFERLRIGAEAMRRLKPHEVRALVLKAEGLSYEEICAETGWTYTKVNRCLSEGRRRFHDRVAGIESGAECERLAPLLSALADGEARAEDLAALRPHLRTCLVCRARLREYRAAPGRVAALIPPVAIFPAIVGWLHGRAAAFAARWHAGFEAASASKIAAVTASTAVLAGGGAVGITAAGGGADPRPASDVVSHPAPTPPETATPAAATPSPARERRADDHPRAARGRWPLAQPAPTNTRTSAADEPVSSPPSGELDPAPAARPPEERSGDAPPGEAGEFAP